MEGLGVGKTGSAPLAERESAAAGEHAHHGLEAHRDASGGDRWALLRRIGLFVGHAVEMCLAMCLGMMVLGPLYVTAAGSAGFADPYAQLPELSAFVVAAIMSLPMAAWMLIRGMQWRPIAEMTGAMFVEAVLLVALAWAGVIATAHLVHLEHTLMVPAMLVPMLLRLDMYTQGHAHHRAHAG